MARRYAIDNPKVKEFLEKVEALSREYDVSIGHEDFHGGFKIEDFYEHNIKWLKEAEDDLLASKSKKEI